MADTFAYDLVKFLRVIFTRRWFIFKGALGAAVITAIISLIVPETWRTDTNVSVSTPAYKTNLQIADQQGFDVNWYNGILTANSLYREVLDTYIWLHGAVHTLLDTDAIEILKENLNEKAATLTRFQLIENTNLPKLSEVLLEADELEDPIMQSRISILGHLHHEDIEAIYEEDIETYEDWTVHELRQDLSTSIEVLVDTNLAKEFSKNIRVSAEAGSAIEAKMLANIWLNVFRARAEQTVRGIIYREVELQKQRNKNSLNALNTAESTLLQFDRANHLDNIRKEIAAKQILLYGVVENKKRSSFTEETFDFEENTNPPISQKRNQIEESSFTPTSEYSNALLPQKNSLEKEIARLNQANDNPEKLNSSRNELIALTQQIAQVTTSLTQLNETLEDKENERRILHRRVEQAQRQYELVQPLLDEANMLESQGGQQQYSDVSIGKAIKPDKRVFPRRSLMTILGGMLGLFLFTGLAFFEDIWTEVTREDGDEVQDTETDMET